MAKSKRSVLWTSTPIPGLEQSAQEREASLLAANKGLAIVRAICAQRLAGVTATRLSKEGYDSPSWAYRQADLVGEERALTYLLDLLDEVCYNSTT